MPTKRVGYWRLRRPIQLAALIEAGPDFERDGVARWRCIDLRQLIAPSGRGLAPVKIGPVAARRSRRR